MPRASATATAPRRVALGSVVPLAAVALLGVLVLLTAAALDDRDRAFTVGLPPVRIAAVLQPTGDVCRSGIDVPASFSRVRLATATFRRPGPPLTVTVGAVRGKVAGGYPDNSTVEARVDTVAKGERINVCIRNDGKYPVAVLGSPPETPAYRLSQPSLESAIGLEFLRDEPRTTAGLVPEMFERASRFRPDFVGPWAFWILLGLVVAGLPALLAAAHRSAVNDDSP